MKRALMAAFCAACCWGINGDLKAQELVSNAGGFAETANASLGWTIGQVTTETFEASGYFLTQGFHQSNIMVTAIRNSLESSFHFIVYPNPTSSYFLIESEGSQTRLSNYTLLMYDMRGNMVLRRKSLNDLMVIDMKDYAPSVYLLKIVDPDIKATQTFHIIKH